MSKVQERYNKLAEKLETLQEQKRRQQVDEIMDAYLKSGRSYEESMMFLTPLKSFSAAFLQVHYYTKNQVLF